LDWENEIMKILVCKEGTRNEKFFGLNDAAEPEASEFTNFNGLFAAAYAENRRRMKGSQY
jgi:hypothetical protein